MTNRQSTISRNRTFAYLAARTLFYDQFVTRALDAGIQQVVIVAAGYDSRAWRLATRLRDVLRGRSPGTQSVKRSRAPANRPIFVAAAATCHNVSLRPDMTRKSPTVFTVEGLAMYLSRAQVTDQLEALAHTSGPESRLAVNFGVAFDQSNGTRGRVGRMTTASSREHFRFRLSQSIGLRA